MEQVNTPNGTRHHAEWFTGEPSLEVELSRYRFVYAGVPSEHETWVAIHREYERLSALRDATHTTQGR